LRILRGEREEHIGDDIAAKGEEREEKRKLKEWKDRKS
jgi:hypothetical protein